LIEYFLDKRGTNEVLKKTTRDDYAELAAVLGGLKRRFIMTLNDVPDVKLESVAPTWRALLHRALLGHGADLRVRIGWSRKSDGLIRSGRSDCWPRRWFLPPRPQSRGLFLARLPPHPKPYILTVSENPVHGALRYDPGPDARASAGVVLLRGGVRRIAPRRMGLRPSGTIPPDP